jgi:ABC-type uncharacterized transport system ATPase subunit
MLGQMNSIAKLLSLSFLGSSQGTHFRKKFKQIADHLNFSLQPDVSVKSLTIGERQQLEILRLLSQGTQILILDEPTTGISGIQKEILFNALRELASEGKSIILVSHKLEDVESLCNKVTVLRQGRVTGEMDKPFDTGRLLEMMFGSPPVPSPRLSPASGEDVLVMIQVSAPGERTGLKNCNIVVRQGSLCKALHKPPYAK